MGLRPSEIADAVRVPADADDATFEAAVDEAFTRRIDEHQAGRETTDGRV